MLLVLQPNRDQGRYEDRNRFFEIPSWKAGREMSSSPGISNSDRR